MNFKFIDYICRIIITKNIPNFLKNNFKGNDFYHKGNDFYHKNKI